MPLPFESQRYENPRLWDPSQWAGQAADIRRAQQVLSAIPSGVKKILDVGSGNGLLARENQRGFRIISLERSQAALRQASGDRVLSDAANIPFKDGSFEAVVSMEVIEHLPLQTYLSALDEISRLSRTLIVLTVPYCENLAYNQVTCPSCLTRFHPYYHLRSFNKLTLTRLFQRQGWHCLLLEGIEAIRIRRLPTLWNQVRLFYHRNGANLPEHALCPVCGYARRASQSNIGKVSSSISNRGLRTALAALWPTAPSYQWWMAVYSPDEELI